MSKISELLIGKLKKKTEYAYSLPTYCNRKPRPDHELCPLKQRQRQRQRQHLKHVENENSQGHSDELRWHLSRSRPPSKFLHTKLHHVASLLINQKIWSPVSMAQTQVLQHFPWAGSGLSSITLPGAFSARPAHKCHLQRRIPTLHQLRHLYFSRYNRLLATHCDLEI